MTTSRPALPGPLSEVARIPGAVVPDPDRETLARVLDGLRDLPAQVRRRRAPAPAGDTASVVPLPRRRPQRHAPASG